jgi:hypothetical protein
MRMQRSLRGSAAVLAALVLAAPAAARAQDGMKVLRLRTEKVPLYDCADSARRKTEFARKDFQGSWPVVSGGTTPSGFLRVQVGGEQYCVRAYAVETDKPIAASSECGAVVAAAQQKSAATRGLGAECKK